MTIDELLAREEIRGLMATYNTAGDSLRLEEFGSVFTEDGVLMTTGFRLEGRKNIIEGLFPAVTGSNINRRSPKFVRHNLTTSKIVLDSPYKAAGRTYFQVNTDIGLDHCGVYTDEFRKEEGGWKISRRAVRTEYWSADSYFRPEEKEE